jgi:hypothetical protein
VADFLPALDVRLATFSAVSAAFPLAPYGGVYLPAPADENTVYPPPFAGSPETLLRLEAAVLANTRHAALAQAPRGPVFLPVGATAPNPSLDRAATPQGLLLELAADGAATGLVLAMSPAYPPAVPAPSYLRFDKNTDGLLPPVLGNILTRDQLFLVMSDLPPDIAGFDNLLDIAGFNLQFDIGAAGGTVLVFKFNTQQSLASLAAQPASWADAETFSADPVGTSARLCAMIADAAGSANAEAFATFQAIIDDPGWTGMLAFAVQVNGSGMPPDLQMLLGGINGDLRAHHLGVEANKMQPGPPGGASLVLTDSSLFGVIKYDAASVASPAKFPDYEVEHLLVVFSNSRITQSEMEIGVTFDALFGRPIWLRGSGTAAGTVAPPPNTLQISGVSQTVDGIDTVSFTTTTPIFFDFQNPANSTTASRAVRVLDSVEITRASLVPFTSSQASPGAPTLVSIRLLLEGQLWFGAAPFPTPSAIDLFSYGVQGAGGLPFNGLVVEISFALDPVHGSLIPGSKSAVLDETLVTATPNSGALRPGSLLDSLPMQFSRYVSAPGGLTAAATGASAVHILDLEGTTSTAGASRAATPPYTTSAPLRALEFDIHLGSLGSMSDDGAGIAAKLLLGWGPSANVPDNDAAGLLVQLPHLGGGVAGFSLEGLLTTRFGDANLLRVSVPVGAPPSTATETVYALLFNNVQLSFLGTAYPPGLLVDFLLFAGAPPGTQRRNNNIAWFLGATQAAS